MSVPTVVLILRRTLFDFIDRNATYIFNSLGDLSFGNSLRNRSGKVQWSQGISPLMPGMPHSVLLPSNQRGLKMRSPCARFKSGQSRQFVSKWAKST